MGVFNLSYNSSKSFDGYSTSRLVSSWGKSFNDFTVNASFEKSLDGSKSRFQQKGAFYISLSLPLGAKTIRAYTGRRGDTIRSGAAYSERINDHVNYRVSAERQNDSSDKLISGNVSLLPRYVQLNLGASRSDFNSTYTGQIFGGIVAHKNGVTLSPYPVQDTFGIAEIGDASGVKISTPYGPVWTDFSGQAVIPHLDSYKNSSVEISTQTLPRRLDLLNGYRSVEAGRGSVNYVNFDVIKVQRLLINTTDEQGEALPKGSAVLDTDYNFITTVLDSGVIFISNYQPGQKLNVAMPDAKSCVMIIEPLKEINDDAIYETTSAVCHAP